MDFQSFQYDESHPGNFCRIMTVLSERAKSEYLQFAQRKREITYS